MPRDRAELCQLLLEESSHELNDQALADVIDALAWNPRVGLDLRHGAAVLRLAARGDRNFARRLRRIAADTMALDHYGDASAGRAVFVGGVLRQLLEGKPTAELDALADPDDLVLLARSWLERGVANARRLEALIARYEL